MISVVLRNTGNPRQPGDLGVLRGEPEETRTRGFASLALARFAFIELHMALRPTTSSRGKHELTNRGLGADNFFQIDSRYQPGPRC